MSGTAQETESGYELAFLRTSGIFEFMTGLEGEMDLDSETLTVSGTNLNGSSFSLNAQVITTAGSNLGPGNITGSGNNNGNGSGSFALNGVNYTTDVNSVTDCTSNTTCSNSDCVILDTANSNHAFTFYNIPKASSGTYQFTEFPEVSHTCQLQGVGHTKYLSGGSLKSYFIISGTLTKTGARSFTFSATVREAGNPEVTAQLTGAGTY